ncbi:biotin--[acetyl-CoA-carboxylase] ligase [Variovorax sp. VNK109]|uniref:biotin--[acetyl-CoA-carboxylase] ligase n=1 Tax=Variovorax sp. VNK109 TaxID=3400919 RepID=UPI003C01DE92
MRWGAEAIWEAIVPLLPGFTVEVLPEIGSTNTELMRRARAGELEPALLVAERQTAGRGRLGRIWRSQTDGTVDSLTFSFGVPLAPADWSGLSLAVGVAVAESLHPQAGLKWPNDLWVSTPAGFRKLGGILIETASFGDTRYAVIGIGINIAPNDGDGMSTPPAALQDLLPGVDAPQALARLALPLAQTVKAFEHTGFAPFQARFNARDVLLGRAVTLSDGTSGTAHGAAPDGAMLVHTAAGMKHVTSAEISVRPTPSNPSASSEA